MVIVAWLRLRTDVVLIYPTLHIALQPRLELIEVNPPVYSVYTAVARYRRRVVGLKNYPTYSSRHLNLLLVSKETILASLSQAAGSPYISYKLWDR